MTQQTITRFTRPAATRAEPESVVIQTSFKPHLKGQSHEKVCEIMTEESV
jgi:hypothetical protein